MSDLTSYQGTDEEVNVEILDDNGDAINIDDLLELYVYVIHKKLDKLESSYSKAGGGKGVVRTSMDAI